MLLLAAWACARGAPKATLPVNATMMELAQVDQEGPFAWAPHGKQVAFARQGLRVTTLDGSERLLYDRSPTAVAWSPDGGRLVAAFVDAGDETFSEVWVLDAQGGQKGKTRIKGRVRHIFWPEDNTIFFGAAELAIYSFGSNFKTTLYQWNGLAEPTATALRDTTLKRSTVDRLGSRVVESFFVSLSPFGTEILYSQPVDPPVFPARLEITLRHLETGLERRVASVALMSSGALFSADGERVLCATGEAQSLWIDPWTGEESRGYEAVAWELARSPSGRYAWLDGRLFEDHRRVGLVPSASEARFSPDGSRLLARRGASLLLLSGLREPRKVALTPEVRAKLLSLRRWLFQDLISREDYLSRKAKDLSR